MTHELTIRDIVAGDRRAGDGGGIVPEYSGRSKLQHFHHQLESIPAERKVKSTVPNACQV
jgi:hypothetical protein